MKNRYTVVKICKNCVFPQGLYRLRDKETGWKIIIEDKKDVDCIKDYLITKDNQIRSLEEQLKNAIALPCKYGDTIYAVRTTRYGWNEKKYWIEDAFVQEIGCDRKGWYVTAGGTRSNLSSCGKNWFVTKAEAEKRLAELKGENNG